MVRHGLYLRMEHGVHHEVWDACHACARDRVVANLSLCWVSVRADVVHRPHTGKDRYERIGIHQVADLDLNCPISRGFFDLFGPTYQGANGFSACIQGLNNRLASFAGRPGNQNHFSAEAPGTLSCRASPRCNIQSDLWFELGLRG